MKKHSDRIELEAERLSRQAKEYAFTACQCLSLTNLDPARSELEDAVEAFQVHYLFPNVSEPERHSIMALRYAKRGLWITLKTAERVPGLVSESVMTEREHFYLEMKRPVDEMLPKLTLVQQQILEGPLFGFKW